MSNATYLFEEPSRNYHNSESFWTSLFALYLIYLSKKNINPNLQAYKCNVEGDKRSYKPDGILYIPKNLDFRNVVVEGRVRDGFIPDLTTPVPMSLNDLRPDILVQKENEVIIIEVKTIGEKIKQYQKDCYEQISSFLKINGYKTSLYFLISAGHEKSLNILKSDPSSEQTFKLLLWEQVFKHIYTENPESMLAKCLGDITDYYMPEEEYMNG